MIPFRVLGDRVVVVLEPKVYDVDEQTGYAFRPKGEASGIVIAQTADAYDLETATRGLVVGVGHKSDQVSLETVLAYFADAPPMAGEDIRTAIEHLAPAPFEVEIGQCVGFAPSAGDQLTWHGLTYVILRESEILFILERSQEAA